MSHRATAEEERRHSVVNEQRLELQALAEALPVITLRVVYLGSHPKKTVRLPGTVLVETVKDEDEPENAEKWTSLTTLSKDGYTIYDFSTVDSQGKKLRPPLVMPDGDVRGKRWQMVTHYAHLKALWEMRDQDKQQMFALQGGKQALALFKEYVERTRRVRAPDSGASVLDAMGMS